MSELYLSSTPYTEFFSLLISSFIIFLYFVFFFLPFFLKLLPLLTTPFLLLITFLIFSPLFINNNSSKESLNSKVNVDVLENSQPNVDDNGDEDEFFHSLETLEVDETVFDTSVIGVVDEIPKEKVVQAVESSIVKIPSIIIKEEKRFGEFLKELDEFDKLDEKEESSKDTDIDSTKDFNYLSKIKKAHSQRQSTSISDINGELTPSRRSRSMEHDLGIYGKEKEWKRTLAGRLFEERRHNVNEGGEGMDLLWEAYETGNNNKSKGKKEYYPHEENNDDEEEDEEINGPMCCLQAFKFSSGKVNMGVGRRNLSKFSKVIKGFGWLHHVSKQRKKIFNGDTFQFP